MNTPSRDTNSQRRDQRREMGRFGTTKLTMEDSMVRLSGRGLKSGASRLAFAVGLALAVPAVVLTQPAAAQVLIGTSFDCARAGTGQSIPSLVCQTPALQLVDLHQMQAYYTLRHAQPERLQELRNQFTARIQGLVRECSTEQVRASGSQSACVEQTLRDMRNFWVQQIQQTGNAAALEEIRLNSARFWEGQQALRAGGFVQPDAAIDGIYGTGTRQAIVRFQTERGMQAHGFLTSATADALRGLFPAGGAATSSGAQQQRTAAPNQTSQVSRPQENSRAVEGTLERLRQQQREQDPLAQQQSTRERQSSGQTSGAGTSTTQNRPLIFGESVAEPNRGARVPSAASSNAPRGNAPLTQGEIRSFTEQIGECWSVDAGMLGLNDVIVELRVQLDGQGNVRNVVPGDRGIPTDPRERAIYESARRALLSPQCNPLRVPSDKHRTVMESTFRFNSRGLVR